MDEAFIDFGPMDLEPARKLAQTIRDEVYAATLLTVSGGVATGKMIAKIASDFCKPNGLMAIAPGEEAAFLAPMPVGRLWGIGPKTQRRLLSLGVETIGHLAALDDAALRELFGSWGEELRDLARGVDVRTVEPERETKSISSEETFEYDVERREGLDRHHQIAGDRNRRETAARELECANRRRQTQTDGFLNLRPANASHRTDPRRAANLSRRRILLTPRQTRRRAGASARHARRVVYRGRAVTAEFVRRGEGLAARAIHGGDTRLHAAAAAMTVVAAFDSSS